MKRQWTAIPALTAFLACTAHAPTASALTIESEFLGGSAQVRAVGGGNLEDIFNAAASVWEKAILDPFTLHLSYGWALVGGGEHWLLEQSGFPNRETAGQILFNNDEIDGHFVWFLDPDPLSNSAFGPMTEQSADLGGGVINVAREFSEYSSTVGSDVLNCLQCSDLFTTALHEIGHSLGMSNANFSFIDEGADGQINITSQLPFSGSSLPLATNIFGVVAHFDNSNILAGTVMGGRNGYAMREYPSEADILGVSQLSGFRDINLDPMRPPTAVPEPDVLPLLATGMAVLWVSGGLRRRRMRTRISLTPM